MFLNENNLQAPFQYKISENSFKLEKINNSLQLSEDNSQIKVFEGERLFCVDIGYGINGALEDMEFILDGVRVYPLLLDDINCIRELEEVEENKIYLIKNDINFKSIIFLSVTHLNKKFEYSITAYNTTLSSWMFDYIAKKINSLDIDYPIKNYYNKTNYKINDIIKHNGYLYKVNKDFLSDDSDYYLKSNCSLLTPFKSLEIGNSYNVGDILEYENNFFSVSKNFIYSEENDIYDFIKPLIEIINWFDGIKKIYKNQIIIKNGLFYLVLDYAENPIWNDLLRDNKIKILSKASNIFYDDNNTSFGDNTNNIQLAIEKLKKEIDNKIPTGNLNLANNILYDNSKTNLVYKTNDYDFPKFKNVISENIKLLLSDGTNNYSASITKQEDGSYRLKSNLNNISPMNGMIMMHITSIESETKQHGMSNVLLQFFDNINIISNKDLSNINYTNLELDECSISEIESSFKFAIVTMLSSIYIVIKRQDDNLISQSNYTVNINIKNRVLRNQDSNLFCLPIINSANIQYKTLYLEKNNSTSVIKGSINNLAQGTETSFYIINSIIPNYFILDGDYINTSDILSSSGKALKYKIKTVSTSEGIIYAFLLAYQDGSEIQSEDVFTFNLIPNKNSSLNPIYKNVSNVQELGESLALRYMINPYYVQYADLSGNFNSNEEPSVWFKKMYNVNTTWQIIFNSESVYFRTEGNLANVERSNGIQNDAGRNATGSLGLRNNTGITDNLASGIIFQGVQFTNRVPQDATFANGHKIEINLSRAYSIANEFRVRNRLMRIYKLLTINDKSVNEIMEEF
ncbi:phage tail protein [Brachyspira pilosicoli]|uniref:Phage tail protein n=1 Tax=Brachyspira pilosicoli TaxID=52584 RepID=A0AAJ6G854_BRAPL|nr:phage tail protein [Brachyspira pilosicoli]WIH89769.1 phage tail protein [Brachyspira pilosicoli]WIH92064.1 phage tail protein [Brachyspira pilosicoli]WIH94293.1 phage tail protein [Brachyspira pilosicoli]